MKIEDKLTESILNGIKTLYNQEVPAKDGAIAENQEGV